MATSSHPAVLTGGRRLSLDGLLHAIDVSRALAWRSLILVRRMPSVFLPSLVMPLFILVATSGAFRGIGLLPAFGGASYLAFTIPLALVMGAGFAGMNAGMTLARDIEGGFADRLIASPAPRITLIAGPLSPPACRSLFTTTVVLIAGLIGGIRRRAGRGTLAIYGLAMCFSAASACWCDGRRVPGAHDPGRPGDAGGDLPVGLHLRGLRAARRAHRVAARRLDVNPVTYLMEASRGAELHTLGWAVLWPALVAGAALLVVLGTWAAHRPRIPRQEVAAWPSTASTSPSPPRRLPRRPGRACRHGSAELYREMAGDDWARMMTHPELGALLEVLVQATGGRAVLEVGTFVGISAAWMARALEPGGHMDTLEADRTAPTWPRLVRGARPAGDRIQVHRGPAVATLARLPGRGLRPLLHRRRQDRLRRVPGARGAAGAARRADRGRQRPGRRPRRRPAGRARRRRARRSRASR